MKIIIFLLIRRITILIMFLIPNILSAQVRTIEETVSGVKNITTYNKINNTTEAVKVVVYWFDRPIIDRSENYLLVNGKKEGRHEHYNEGSSRYLEYFHTYSKGILHGESVEYYNNGQIKTIRKYVDGLMEGAEVSYSHDGDILSKGSYLKGQKTGNWISYDRKTLKVRSQGDYLNDKEHGIWQTFFYNGDLKSEKRYINGKVDESFVSTKAIVVPCPNPDALRGVSAMVGSHMKDRSGKNEWLYQTRFLEAACVEQNDSEEIKNQKIRETWHLLEDDLIANSSQFDVVDGNILKYAASTKNDAFIRDAIKWGVNLNRVDPSDNRTVLDYISFHIERHKGNALEGMFAHYYKLLKAGGAKHKNEL